MMKSLRPAALAVLCIALSGCVLNLQGLKKKEGKDGEKAKIEESRAILFFFIPIYVSVDTRASDAENLGIEWEEDDD